MKCKTCGKNSESEYCFQHKPRKALKSVKFSTVKRKTSDNSAQILQMQEFFLDIWKKRKEHTCENCKKWLGSEPLSYMFDHLLEKSKYPDLKLKEENIMLVCLECHDLKTRGFITDFVRDKIEEVRIKFDK